MLAGKKILLGITGSIAAYKMPLLVRALKKKGAAVRVIMTPAAEGFVSPLTLSTLSGEPVLRDLFDDKSWSNHVALGRWANLMLLAPLSCNTLQKMATGACDNLLMAVYLSATCPVMVAPAMDEDMWHHPATRSNLETIARHGVHSLPVGYGELASGLVGEGRMAEPEDMLAAIEDFLGHAGDLKGRKALVTAGPTYESIDPVRFIGNHSSGKMGYAIAAELQRRGADVTLVSGPVHLQALPGVKLHRVQTAGEMYSACMEQKDYDIAVMAAAVADYTPSVVHDQKIKKDGEDLHLELKKTADILAALGREKRAEQVLAGFALETEKEAHHAQQKLQAKNADLIVLNSLRDEGAGFGGDNNKVTLFFRDGRRKEMELKSKKAVASDIVDALTQLLP